jgi:deoxyribodipyrimidine photo-lyase
LKTALVWFRRDLRDRDHCALHHALERFPRVFCAFVFDTEILDELPSRADRRVEFIHGCVLELDEALRKRGGGLVVRHGRAREVIPQLAVELGADAVLANHDYEPLAIARDDAVRGALGAAGVAFLTFKDQVIFEKDEVLTAAGKPFTVFTPYKNAWLKQLPEVTPLPTKGSVDAVKEAIPRLEDLGFEKTDLKIPSGMSGARKLWKDFQERIGDYKRARDFPAVKGPSYLSVHLRFGTLSIRELVAFAAAKRGAGPQTWLSELVWREFYMQLLWHRPDVAGGNFRKEYDAVQWEEGPQAERQFAAWCEGRTGYPLVDAAMRQLNTTGYMHNRLRMVTASFLTKDLGIHWLRGERYFAAKLNDYDLAANNGGWQWAASTGCDAQPWFRIFNPVTQSRKFDPQGKFIRRYLPELASRSDDEIHEPVEPIVDHAAARARTLARFAAVKKRSG